MTGVQRPAFALLDRGLQPAAVCSWVRAAVRQDYLVGDWLGLPRTAAWLSGRADNDSNLFLAYLAAALRQARFDLGPDPQAYLQAAQGAALQPVFAGWINRLSVLDTPLTLVLDDYQFITNPAIHEGMAFLLDHLPPRVHLLLATRTDPPLPLHRYRARRQMVEVRADDLRFTPQEIDLFLQQSAGVTLGDEQIRVLDERIEGWAAGIQMAVLSFERQPDLSRFIQSLSGSRRYILDYLAEEVLNNQPPDLRRFLLQISVLERFCVPLCDAVAGGPPGSAAGHLDAIGPRQPVFGRVGRRRPVVPFSMPYFRTCCGCACCSRSPAFPARSTRTAPAGLGLVRSPGPAARRHPAPLSRRKTTSAPLTWSKATPFPCWAAASCMPC